MTATAGGRCVDVAVCTFSHPANLRRLSHALVRLLGQRFQTHMVTNTHLEVNIKTHTLTLIHTHTLRNSCCPLQVDCGVCKRLLLRYAEDHGDVVH